MDDVNRRVLRRAFLRNMSIFAGAISSFETVLTVRPALAQTKLTHDVAKYEGTPHNGQQCSTCLQFEPPNACKIVESPISPQGWCQFYVKKT